MIVSRFFPRILVLPVEVTLNPSVFSCEAILEACWLIPDPLSTEIE